MGFGRGLVGSDGAATAAETAAAEAAVALAGFARGALLPTVLVVLEEEKEGLRWLPLLLLLLLLLLLKENVPGPKRRGPEGKDF